MKGTIARDPERKTWMFSVDLRPVNGKRRQAFRRGFATKKEAAVALAQMVADDSCGTGITPRRVTVATFLRNEWLPVRRASIKPSTAAGYAGTIDAYIIQAIGTMQLSKVDGGVLNAMYADLLANGLTGASGRTGGLSPKSVRNIHGLLHRAFKDAVRWGRLNINPCDAADQPRNDPPEMLAWSAEELRLFLAHVADDRLSATWRLLATTGLRRGELLGLRWSDVDLDRGTIAVRQTRIMVNANRPPAPPNRGPEPAPSRSTPGPPPFSRHGNGRRSPNASSWAPDGSTRSAWSSPTPTAPSSTHRSSAADSGRSWRPPGSDRSASTTSAIRTPRPPYGSGSRSCRNGSGTPTSPCR